MIRHTIALRSIYAATASYYTSKATEFGATPFGVDWTCVATQEMRFVQLLRICNFEAGFALNDIGCGYGGLFSFLDREHASSAIDYLGIDVSAAMVRLARKRLPQRRAARFLTGHAIPRVADYSVASGIFNVRLDQAIDAWEAFVIATLQQMADTSRRGFAVNFTSASSPGLYAPDPGQWADHCDRHLGADTEIVGDYGLSEFTLLVRLRPHSQP